MHQLLVIRDRTFMIQQKHETTTLVSISFNASEGPTIRGFLGFINNAWCFSLWENVGYWSRGNNIGISMANTIEQSLNDMLGFIRMCNYGR